MGESVKLTKRAVDALKPRDTRYNVTDSEISGFRVRVTPSGKKSFFFRYRVGGGRSATIKEPKIGDLGQITPEQARQIALTWAAEVRQGGDPGGARQEAREALTMGDLFKRYMKDHADVHKKKSSAAEDERSIRLHLKPVLGRKKVTEVTRRDVSALHSSLAGSPYQANRCLALLSKAFNLAELWGLRPDGSNPCRHVKKFKEEKRERFLSQDELAGLGDALRAAERGELVGPKGARISLYAVAAIRLLILTGARRGEILTCRWDHVNFEAARLELPDSKTGAKHIYLPAPALALLQSLPKADKNPFVIVGGKPESHLINLKDPWAAIRKVAGLEDVRIHDLRHSFASVGAGGGMSLPVIGALLGHKETATTARYAHLSDDPLRTAADAIGGRIGAALGLVEIPKKDAADG